MPNFYDPKSIMESTLKTCSYFSHLKKITVYIKFFTFPFVRCKFQESGDITEISVISHFSLNGFNGHMVRRQLPPFSLSGIRNMAVYTTGFQCFYSLLIYKVKEVNYAPLVHLPMWCYSELVHVSHRALGIKRFFACEVKQNPSSCNSHTTLC